MTTTTDSSTARPGRRIDGGALALAALGLATILVLAWGFTLRQDLNDAEARNANLESEIALLRERANATAYTLSPSADAPANALGTAFFTVDGTGVISVSNLEQAPEGRRYQVWFSPTDDAEPIPGAVFTVDEHGSGFMLIPADVGVFTTVTITLEPEAGVTSPTGPVILTGTTGGARG